MNSGQPLSPIGRLLFGLIFVACGLLPILAAFDIGPVRQGDINGPPWLAGVAGGIFVIGGLAVMAGEGNRNRDHPLSYVLLIVLLAAFAAIGNWIAFAPGPRQCSASFTSFFATTTRAMTELWCRVPFGIGALMVDGFLVYLLANAPKKFLGANPVTRALEKLGLGVVLLSLAPVLLPLLVFVIGKGLFASLREYLESGHWPRNESLIARLKKRRDNQAPDGENADSQNSPVERR